MSEALLFIRELSVTMFLFFACVGFVSMVISNTIQAIKELREDDEEEDN